MLVLFVDGAFLGGNERRGLCLMGMVRDTLRSAPLFV
jgi:hypothetical protein